LSRIVTPATESPAEAAIQFPVHQALYPHYRTYLQGLYAAMANDRASAERSAALLKSLTGSEDEQRLARNLALGIRAEIAMRQGQRTEALTLLKQRDDRMPYLLRLTSPFYSGARERYRRAELLEQSGQLEEALRWYAGLDNQSYLDVAYLAPSLLKRGQISEQLGRRDAAAGFFRRVLALWSDADPEFKPMVEEARAGLERVKSEG
jgi:tetratricopeptide (TPR) repeat protein